MKNLIAIVILIALAACSSPMPVSREDTGQTQQALTPPTYQPFPGFIAAGKVGTNGFGVPTPIGISTLSGLGVGTLLNMFNLRNSSAVTGPDGQLGLYHNDYGWSINAAGNQVCNLASPGVCWSAQPAANGDFVLAASTDPNSLRIGWLGGAIESLITGQCVFAQGGPNSGAALLWGPCSTATPFAGIGFHAGFSDSSGNVHLGISGPIAYYLLSGSGSPQLFPTVMDQGFYQLLQNPFLGAGEYVFTIPLGYAQPTGTQPTFAINQSGRFYAPTACPGSTTTTTASMAPTITGMSGVCDGAWHNDTTHNAVNLLGSNTTFTVSYTP